MTTPPTEQLPPTLVSRDELIRYMSDISLTDSQKAAVDDSLRGVQGELEIYLNRPVQPVHIREVAMGSCDGSVYLTVTPVHRVLSVSTYNGAYDQQPVTQLDPVPMEEVEGIRGLDDAVGFGANFRRIPGGIYGSYSNQYVLVEYIGGYIGYWDEGLKQAIKRVAAREIESNHDDSVNLRPEGGGQTAASDPRQRGWTQDELRALDRLRRRVMA